MTTATTIYNGFDSKSFRLSPPATSIRITPSTAIIQALPNTDYWRIPASPGEEAANRHTGAFYAVPIDGNRSFEAGVWIQGKWGVQYDQGCLMVVADDSDGEESSWIKTGVEMDDGKQWIGGVVASHWSDWSIALASKNTSQLSEDPYWLFIRIVRLGTTVRVFHLFSREPFDVQGASPELLMMREVKGFNHHSANLSHHQWRVGVMVCGPKNDAGTEATFKDFYVKYL
ncbi:hypothetical protein CCMSSC00406_0007254 [Pleurotus cornucopiae]|uniref:Uncharacterized protein n=1 Tax=Pleurotus cornucopiae TaxID=5321 RepID=A0ACB7IJW0_PLECO|nr:hypothetical protein CCMSSC00406_0007254 [Pleurotus cornucopiae]